MILKYIVILVILGTVAAILYIRFAPLDPITYNIDPNNAPPPSRGHYMVRDGANAAPPVYDATREELADILEAIIESTPNTEHLAGDLRSEPASWVTLSDVLAFPDVASVRILDLGDGRAAPVILSRQVYGMKDLGVNEARVKSWLEQLDAAMNG